jgi:D-alanyl-lipoteichoic acid acyltransferase DltB (MBOAT superfamily)
MSLAFYAWGEAVFVFVMLFSICINWVLVILLEKHEKKRNFFLVLTLTYNIVILFIFKYLSFLIRTFGIVWGNDDFKLNIVLPIGISFYTFQIMSYVFDVYYRKAGVQKNLIDMALYVSLFPQLIAGPIIRYKTVCEEINNRIEAPKDFTAGMERFVIGLSKKVLIANYVGFIADGVFNSTDVLSVASAWLGGIAYTLQIYFDFSAYSDMAIGLGRIFGFHFQENFNYPYMAKSITDFWRRWHISLSTWFRDYVYIPLGGSRVSKKRLVVNLFVVWLLTGIWHGANWTFIVWGLYYFILITIERFMGINKKSCWLSHLYTVFFVIIGWVIFRSESLVDTGKMLRVMFGFGAVGLVDEFFYIYFLNAKWVLVIGLLLSTPIVSIVKERFISKAIIYQIIYSSWLAVIFVLSILASIKATYNPFIYFNF